MGIFFSILSPLFFFYSIYFLEISFPLKESGGDYSVMWVDRQDHAETKNSLQGV